MPRRPRVCVAGAAYRVYRRTADGGAGSAEMAEAKGLVAVLRQVARDRSALRFTSCRSLTPDP